MALLKKRKYVEDELIYSEDVGINWKNLFDSGKISKWELQKNKQSLRHNLQKTTTSFFFVKFNY